MLAQIPQISSKVTFTARRTAVVVRSAVFAGRRQVAGQPTGQLQFPSQPLIYRCFTTATTTEQPQPQKQPQTPDKIVLYESPLARIVTRLRAVSLLSALTGSVGLPLFCAVRGIEHLPSKGILAFGMTFAAGSVASTVAIHYVFSPYIYQIYKIPIRKCQGEPKENWAAETTTDANHQQHQQNCLLQAVSRSLILTKVETVFDPETDVVPYKGWRPLCNLLIKGKPLYVHPEFVQSTTLRKQLHLRDPEEFVPQTNKENPDDFL